MVSMKKLLYLKTPRIRRLTITHSFITVLLLCTTKMLKNKEALLPLYLDVQFLNIFL